MAELRKITVDEFREILSQHKEWIDSVEKSGAKADLSGCDLRPDTDRIGSVNLEGVNLMRANLEMANLSGANLKNANLSGANFENADLENANLIGSKLEMTNFEKANLDDVNLEDARLDNTYLKKATLKGVNLKNAQLEWLSLEWVDLGYANLKNARLIEVSLKNSNLTGVDLSGAVIHSVNLKKANLEYANLEGVEFNDVSFEGANLRSATFKGKPIEGVDFRSADLQDASFFDIELSLVKFEDADLRDTRWCPLKKDSYVDLLGFPLIGVRKYTYLSSCFTEKTKFSFGVNEPWHILKRNYSGLMFLVVLICSLSAFLPYVAEAVILKGSDELKGLMPEFIQETKETHIITHILGFNQANAFWHVSTSILLIGYNGLRAFVTYMVNGLRHEEQESQFTPAKKDYNYLFLTHMWFLRWVFFFSFCSLMWKLWDLLSTKIQIPA